MPVVVVESPAKAKTINKYLGDDYTVLASYGHVRDLPPKNGSVDPDEAFEMKWEIASDSKKHVKAIADALKDDPDSPHCVGITSSSSQARVAALGLYDTVLTYDELQSVDPDEAVATALQAFLDGLYLVFIDDVEQRDLDAQVFLTPESKLTFLRLTFLAGA